MLNKLLYLSNILFNGSGTNHIVTMSTSPSTKLPEPDFTVPYVSYKVDGEDTPNGKLMLFGEVSSPTTALLCAGFYDDHTIFLPFAKALSEKIDVLVGVMCLPGYDDRPEDGMPWQNHPREGFTFSDTADSVASAAQALQTASTHANPKLVGIFHDWGCAAGSLWAKRTEEQAQEDPTVLKPDRVVFFDVLFPAAHDTPDRISSKDARQFTTYEKLCYIYQPLMASSSWLAEKVSSRLAGMFMVFNFSILYFANLTPTRAIDAKSRALYNDNGKRMELDRIVYMGYMYRNGLPSILKGKVVLHKDWKTTPILYMWGPEKNTQFHSPAAVDMLQREHTEQRSLSNAIVVEGAGHFLYVPDQKLDECVEHVVNFVRAENTFASEASVPRSKL